MNCFLAFYRYLCTSILSFSFLPALSSYLLYVSSFFLFSISSFLFHFLLLPLYVSPFSRSFFSITFCHIWMSLSLSNSPLFSLSHSIPLYICPFTLSFPLASHSLCFLSGSFCLSSLLSDILPSTHLFLGGENYLFSLHLLFNFLFIFDISVIENRKNDSFCNFLFFHWQPSSCLWDDSCHGKLAIKIDENITQLK